MALDFDRTYTVKEVSELLGLSLSTIYDLIKRSPEAGGIPAFKFASAIRVKESDLQRWIEAQAIKR